MHQPHQWTFLSKIFSRVNYLQCEMILLFMATGMVVILTCPDFFFVTLVRCLEQRLFIRFLNTSGWPRFFVYFVTLKWDTNTSPNKRMNDGYIWITLDHYRWGKEQSIKMLNIFYLIFPKENTWTERQNARPCEWMYTCKKNVNKKKKKILVEIK